MIKEYQYVNIRRVLDELKRHPLLQDITLEQVVSYVVSFIGIFGMPKLYTNKQERLQVEEFRAMLPCDLVSINQVKECKSGICLRSMTDNFMPEEHFDRISGRKVPHEMAFKTQGRVIYTSFKEGEILVSYKAIPIDKEGYPLLVDNPVFLKALEAYIKKEAFTILFDIGKINQAVLQNARQQYAWLAGQLQSEFTIPSQSEMESITRMWTSLVQKTREFDHGFQSLGNREYIKLQ